MATVTAVTKNVITRDWTEIEPKLVAVAAGLASSAVLIEVAALFHYDLNPALATAIAGLISLLVGYAKHSTATFPTAAVVASAGEVVATAVPSIASQVGTVESVIAPAFVPAVPTAPVDTSVVSVAPVVSVPAAVAPVV